MNPIPANNQITDNNNQPINTNPTPEPTPTPEPQLPPVQNTRPLQLENETPMDITIYPSNENPNTIEEPQKITEISNQIEIQPVTSISQELPPLPPLPTLNQEIKPTESLPIPNLTQTEVINNNPLSAQESKLTNPNTQKIAIIGGVLFGILLVTGISVYYLTSMTTKKAPISDKIAAPVTPKPIPVPVIPVNQNITTGEYKLRIDSIFLKLNNTLKNNPINLSANVLSTETVKFVSDEVFALATEVNELNIQPELASLNSRLNQELTVQVQIYDNLLKSYKTSNNLTPEMKNKFSTDLKASSDRLNLINTEIKNLK
jgi:hypothetical protein